MNHELRTAADSIASRIIAWRRHLHAHPELSTEERQTARFIAHELKALDLSPQENVGDTHGLIADIGPADAPAVALRADMDALPIHEAADHDYISTNPGVMHACGHDAHVAMLLGAATILADRRDHLPRRVRLIFQPSEERAPGGAAPMIAAGALDDVDRVFGLHIWSEMPLGAIGTRAGPFMAGVSDFHITIHGRGGHAAMPQQCIDPIVIAAEIITALQTAISRSIGMADGGVVSVTRVEAGTATNVIPPEAHLHGTIRTLSEAVRETLHARVRTLAAGIAQAHGADATVEINPGYPPLVNDENAVAEALAAARTVGVADSEILTLPPQGGGEDFAYYGQRVPAAFLFLGARNEQKNCKYPHHHPRFNIDEDALPLGTALLAQLALLPRQSSAT
jgi:amidohydrolase